MTSLAELTWSNSQAGDAVIELARACGLEPAPAKLPICAVADRPAVAAWIEGAARVLGIEAEHMSLRYAELAEMLRGERALLLPVRDGFLAQIAPGLLLGPGLRRVRVPVEGIRSAVTAEHESKAMEGLGPVLDRMGLRESERVRARRALLDGQLANRLISAWILRVPVSAPWGKLFRQGPWRSTILKIAALQAARLAVYLLAWRVIGEVALGGRVEHGWLLAWALLLLTLTPLHMAGQWMQARFAIALGGLLKQRLLAGALLLEPERVLSLGSGTLLGKVMESSAVENLSLAGGFAGLVAAIEIASVLAVFLAAGLYPSAAVLVAWVTLGVWLARTYLLRAREWTGIRMDLTNGLVERMVGHRTRLAQEAPDRWHDGEDHELAHYLDASRQRDRSEALMTTLLPQGWMVMGVASLAGAFLGGQSDAGSLAAGLGGVLMASASMRKLSSAAWQLIDAWIAREQIRELSESAETPEPAGSPAHAVSSSAGSAIEIQDVIYRYPGAEEPVLRRCSLRIEPGDRVVLEGASGGGKSTLAAVLAGLRTPRSGLLLAGGLDRATVGSGSWRRRVGLAPQFHQNHVITAPIGFNLLMGRPGPYLPADEEEARRICEELGLGPLLERMPGGIGQMVGESGWQMSQGERSRVFLARALLQGADLVILDESFGALDPETRKLAVDCAVRRAKALLVIAHR